MLAAGGSLNRLLTLDTTAPTIGGMARSHPEWRAPAKRVLHDLRHSLLAMRLGPVLSAPTLMPNTSERATKLRPVRHGTGPT